MNEYARYENMRYEMAECAEVVRQVLGLTVPVSIKDLMSAMDKIGIQCISDNNLNTDTEIRVLPKKQSGLRVSGCIQCKNQRKKSDFLPGFGNG